MFEKIGENIVKMYQGNESHLFGIYVTMESPHWESNQKGDKRKKEGRWRLTFDEIKEENSYKETKSEYGL